MASISLFCQFFHFLLDFQLGDLLDRIEGEGIVGQNAAAVKSAQEFWAEKTLRPDADNKFDLGRR